MPREFWLLPGPLKLGISGAWRNTHLKSGELAGESIVSQGLPCGPYPYTIICISCYQSSAACTSSYPGPESRCLPCALREFSVVLTEPARRIWRRPDLLLVSVNRTSTHIGAIRVGRRL
jgi:hypothetical protein